MPPPLWRLRWADEPVHLRQSGKDPAHFYGRKEAAPDHEPPASSASNSIIGERRIGKHSFLTAWRTTPLPVGSASRLTSTVSSVDFRAVDIAARLEGAKRCPPICDENRTSIEQLSERNEFDLFDSRIFPVKYGSSMTIVLLLDEFST
jgi:hypothetical protein